MNFWSIKKMYLQHNIYPTAFVHNNNYIWFFKSPMYLWQKFGKKTLSDIMNASVSHKIRAITFSGRNTWRKSYVNSQFHKGERHSESKVFHVSCKVCKFNWNLLTYYPETWMRQCCQTSMLYSCQFWRILFIVPRIRVLNVLQKLMS